MRKLPPLTRVQSTVPQAMSTTVTRYRPVAQCCQIGEIIGCIGEKTEQGAKQAGPGEANRLPGRGERQR